MKYFLVVLALSLTKTVQPSSLQPSCTLSDFIQNACQLDSQQSGDAQASDRDLVTECPPNVVFVVDGSDSVSPSGYRLALQSLSREIRTVTQTFAGTHVGVVLFSNAIQDIPFQQRTPAEIEDLIRQVQNIPQPRRKTSISQALTRAREMLQEYSLMESRAYNRIKSGSVIVLVTDGQTDNRKEILQEAKLAKDGGALIVSLSLENPDRQLLKYISHVVQDHMTPVNWTTLVACPARVLDPVPKGRSCRNFLVVVDGSDSVLRHQETVGQFLVYTALRYRLVNNAIGVNVYGTDSQVQAADTRIRLEDDKYDLADKIRLRLAFPTSGGTGTDRAIAQSVEMLNDDLRQAPSALILITDGPTFDPQATRSAIQNARNSNYPVYVIRVGTALTNEELSVITGGDLTNVFSVNSFTDLFSVDFDGRICDACQSRCPSNARQSGQCGCTCTDPDFEYVASNNSCVRTDRSGCILQCPSNANRGTGCTCVCLNGRTYNEATRTCDCPLSCPSSAGQTEQCGCVCLDPSLVYSAIMNACVAQVCPLACPSNAQRISNCGCQCVDSNQVYNSFSNQCVCSQQCPSNAQRIGNCGCQCVDSTLVYNNFSNQCVPQVCTLACPSNAQRISNCGCQCVDSNQVYNSFSNQCVAQVCPVACPSNAQRISNCGCQCVDSNQVYNSFSNQCVCSQECPTTAQRIGNCGCQCVDSTQVYNTINNQCVPQVCTLACPSNAQRISNCGCQCVDSNQVYNSFSNQCVAQGCPLACPSNAQRISNCGCQCVDSNQVYNSFSNQCVSQVCPVACPSNAQRISNCGCQCVDSNQIYTSFSNQCVCSQECPSNAQRIGNCGCQCVDSTLVYNNFSNQCVSQVCPLACPSNAQRISNCGCQCVVSNQVYNSFSNQCVCSQQCPSNAQSIGNCGCQCVDSTQVYNNFSNQCVAQVCPLACPSNAQRISNCGCQCVDSNQIYNSFSNQCVCSQECPSNAQRIGNCGCQCVDSNLAYNSINNQCVAQVCALACPSNAQRISNCGCQCVDSNQIYNSFSNQCVCSQQCPSNAQRIINCGCQCVDSTMVYNNFSNQCVAQVCPLACPSNAQRISNCGCQCVDGNQIYNSFSNQCVCSQECPTNAQRIGNCGCQCVDSTLIYNSINNQCMAQVCLLACPSNAQRISNCGCQCVDSNQVYNSFSNQCEAQVCPLACPSNAQRISNCGCQCVDSNQIYNSFSNQCVCSQQCPSNAQRIGNCGCQCVDSTQVYNNISNQCVAQVCPLACPSNAQRISNCGCQCVDSNLVYNSFSNQCVIQDCRQACPSNAQRTANCGCRCFDNSQFYNINTNQCEGQSCQQACPSNAQRISNCGCQCVDSNQIYNSINNQCVVSVCSRECPGDAVRVGNCDCRCVNSSQVYNVNTNICESVLRQCSRTEFACENNQVAYKDCNDDCFCACSSGFAGTRCEIRLQAELCNDCYYDNGHYHAGVVGYCDMYVSCVPVDHQSNATARPTSFVPYIMSCPPGTFYISRPDGWKGCDFLSNGRCAQDRCESLPAGARYADNVACQSFWQCGADRKLASKLCCPSGQRFDWRTTQCVVDSTCPASCDRNRTGRCTDGRNGTSGECPFDVNANDLNEYFYKERPADRLRCQATDIMNLTLCLCVLNLNVRPSPCLPVVNMTFDQPSNNVEVNVPQIAIGGGIAANFNGTGDVLLKMFAGSGFWTNYFQINLRLNLPRPVSGGRRTAVVTNADCLTMESVSITMDSTNFYFTVYQIGFTVPAVIGIPYAGRADRDGWFSLALIYRRVGEVFFFSGTVGDYTEMYRGTVPLTTNIDLRTCSLHLGQGYNYAGLIGYVDDFQVWRCDPRS